MTFRERFRRQDSLVGSWVRLRDPSVAELTCELGYDFITVDMEHSPLPIDTIIEMARAADAASGATELVVRVPWNEPVAIKRVLDLGVEAVLVPWVSTPEEAREAVNAMQYPPDGIRGMGPFRAGRYMLELEEYLETANQNVLTIIQIETELGLENVEEIAAVDGVDGLFIGSLDLSAALGIIGDGHIFGDQDSETFDDAVDDIITAAHSEGKAVGTLVGSREEIDPWLDRGIDFLSIGSDAGTLVKEGTKNTEAFEAAVERRDN